MRRFLPSCLLLLSFTALSQSPHIKSSATVYIEPMDGYETYLAAALAKKQVPLVLVADKRRPNTSSQAPSVIELPLNLPLLSTTRTETAEGILALKKERGPKMLELRHAEPRARAFQ